MHPLPIVQAPRDDKSRVPSKKLQSAHDWRRAALLDQGRSFAQEKPKSR
jgi:hypothetical protein